MRAPKMHNRRQQFLVPPTEGSGSGRYNRSMRYVLMLALCAIALAAAELKIDHVTAAGSSLKQLQANLSALGIETVYGGPHSNGATEMALVSFPDGSYLELMAPRANAD